MYTSEFFAEPDPSEIAHLVAHHALAVLVSIDDRQNFDCTHVPLLFEPGHGQERLIGHMARPNPHWRRIADGARVLAVFRGPDAYVTPSLYVAEPDVPTWNYSAVHVHARWEAVTEATSARQILDQSVACYETTRGSGWQMSDIPVQLVQALARGVFAFRLHVERIEAAQKLGQDKCLRDVDAVANGLRACPFGGDDTANRMQEVTIAKKAYQS